MDLASRTSEGPVREVHIGVTVDRAAGLDIKVATVGLNSTLDGSWRLQYVSHRAQS